MVVEQIDNPANKHMHYGDTPPIGTINAPDRLPKKKLYSNKEAERIYQELQYDIYETQKHTKTHEKGSFPLVLKIVFGAIGIAALVIFRKNIGKFLKKINPFK